jgi:staphylococcal nuclease domain-containing protein 1
MHDFSLHYKASAPSPAGFTPKAGELVSAKFSGDNGWYRAKVRRSSPAKKECELTFIDYGNQETVAWSNIRPLDQKFRSLPPQAQDARLRYLEVFLFVVSLTSLLL